MLPISQFTVVVEPTAAVAEVPKEPTIAVSMYCTAVCMSCSSMVGHARAITAPRSGILNSERFFEDNSIFTSTDRIARAESTLCTPRAIIHQSRRAGNKP